jgi:hypothetical protein
MHKAGHDIVISLPAEPSEGLVQHRLKTPHKSRTVLPKNSGFDSPKSSRFVPHTYVRFSLGSRERVRNASAQLVFHPVTVSTDIHGRCVVQQAIEQRGQDLIAKERSPVRETRVGRNDQRPSLVSLRHPAEEVSGVERIQRQVADLITDQNLGLRIDPQAPV